MIIGISGKIGSGKDTIGEIVQYLTCKAYQNEKDKYSYSSYLADKANPQHTDWHSKFTIEKYANALKDMVCILLGCTRERLEDRVFKETELGEEWTKYKAWVSSYYTYYSDGTETSSSSEIQYCHFLSEKDAIAWSENYEESNLETVDDFGVVKKVMTPRLLMQLLGTECGRNILHPNVWVNALMSKYIPNKPNFGIAKNISQYYHHTHCEDCDKSYSGPKRQFICSDCLEKRDWLPNWLITDMRFPNEAEAVKDRDGLCIRINRNPEIIGFHQGVVEGAKSVNLDLHPSETALDKYQDWDEIIYNDGTIEDLIKKVKEILIRRNII